MLIKFWHGVCNIMTMNIDTRTKRITIVDTTLRNAEQSRGIELTQEEKLRLAERLSAAGVDELEAGIPVSSRSEQRFLKRLLARGISARINGWCRLRFEDIEEAYRCGLRHIYISIPLSTDDLEASRMTRDQMIERMRSLIREWRSSFDTITLGLQDAFRADFRLLRTIKRMVPLLKIGRIRLDDTRGCALPEEVSALVEFFMDVPGLEVEFYGVNHSGMAAANSFAAVEAGAGAVSLTVHGLGERSGSRNLAELTGLLLQKEKYSLGIKLDELYSLGAYVRGLTEGRMSPAAGPAGCAETDSELDELSNSSMEETVPALFSRGGWNSVRPRRSWQSLEQRLEEERSRRIAGYLKELSRVPANSHRERNSCRPDLQVH